MRGEEIANGYSYIAIFENSEEVAEYGDHAENEQLRIETGGEKLTPEIESQVIEKAKEHMKQTRWDFFRIEETRHREWVYNPESEKEVNDK